MMLDTRILFIILYSIIAFLGICCFILFLILMHLYNLLLEDKENR